MGEWKSKNRSKYLLQYHLIFVCKYRKKLLFFAYFGIPTATLQDWEHERRTSLPYVIGMMERILELEKELSEKG